ncbi:MAG: ferredoxin [Planctomycetota bacterium]
MHVKIVEGCIICRACECMAPNVFVVEERAHAARVLDPHPNSTQEADIVEAIKVCPVHVIRLRRDPQEVQKD